MRTGLSPREWRRHDGTWVYRAAFTISIRNLRTAGEIVPVAISSFRLEDAAGQQHEPILVGINDVPGPGAIASRDSGEALVVFEISGAQPPGRLIWDVVTYIAVPHRGETIEWAFR